MQCPKCQAALDVSAIPAGTPFTCGNCGSTLGRVGAPAASPPPRPESRRDPPPLPPRRTSPRAGSRHAPAGETEEKRLAWVRIGAYKKSNLAITAVGAMVPAWLVLGILGAGICAVVALTSGWSALGTLRRVGTGGEDEVAAGGIVASGARLARHASGRAKTAMGLSAIGLAAALILFFLTLEERRRREEETRQKRLELERLLEGIRDR